MCVCVRVPLFLSVWVCCVCVSMGGRVLLALVRVGDRRLSEFRPERKNENTQVCTRRSLPKCSLSLSFFFFTFYKHFTRNVTARFRRETSVWRSNVLPENPIVPRMCYQVSLTCNVTDVGFKEFCCSLSNYAVRQRLKGYRLYSYAGFLDKIKI